MKIYYLGFPPANYPFELDWRKWGEGPIYEFDALVLFDQDRPLVERDRSKALLASHHGRPVLYFGTDGNGEGLRFTLSKGSFDEKEIAGYERQLAELPRTNYEPIDCNFYDNFESAILQRRSVKLVFREVDGSESRIDTRLLDLKTHMSEEYVQFRDGTWLRLDRIVSVDGVAAGASCTF